MMNRKISGKDLYDKLVWTLLIWCVFQDLVLSFLLKVTGTVGFVKIIFYGKDILTIILFSFAIKRLKAPRKWYVTVFIYFVFVIFQTIISLLNLGEKNIVSFFSSIRGLILLPALMIVGYSIYDKNKFVENIKKYYFFLMVIAAIGIVEYIIDNLIGTVSFWMNFLELENYHIVIKGQPDVLYNGVPWNWHTSGSDGTLTQNRLISVWAAPLTAGFVLLLPTLYYTIIFLKDNKLIVRVLTGKYLVNLRNFLICVVGLYLTYTRQTILPYILISFLILIYFNKKNRKAIIVGGIIFAILLGGTLISTFWEYIYNGSTIVHIEQLINALNSIKFWGSGVGTYGTRFSNTIATESQYVTVMGQLGVIPLFLYLYVYIYPIVVCIKRLNIVNRNKAMVCSICFSGCVFLVAGLASETVAAFTSIAQYYVLMGAAWGYCYERKEDRINGN